MILIIEDEKDVCYLLSKMLKSRGYETVCRESLAEGKEVILNRNIEVLLLDINLADGNGLSLLDENILDNDTRVIVMSAQAHLANEALSKGADSFLSKPFSSERLMLAINGS